MELWQILLIYWIVLCLISYIQFYADKKKAQQGKWRIPEKTLLITAGLGGAAGAMVAMRRFRHKTRHKSFYIGIPAMLVFHMVLAVLVFRWYIYR